MNFDLEHSAAWLLLILPLALGVAGLLYFFQDQRRSFSNSLRISLSAMRFVVLAVLAFLLLEPLFVLEKESIEKPLLLLFEDQSASIPAQELGGVTAFSDQLQKELNDRYDVRSIPFAERVGISADNGLSGLNTDIGSTFRYINDAFAGTNIGAVILASDGIINQGGNPRYMSMGTSAPLFALLLGDTTQFSDLKIEEVKANDLAFLGNNFEIKTLIQADGCKGEQVSLKLLRNGEEIEERQIRVDSERIQVLERFLVPADQIGIARYTVVVESFEEEQNTDNNQADVYVEVLDNRTQVFLLAHAPHPDIAAFKEAIERSDQYEVQVFLFDDWKGETEEADLIITHGLPTSKQDMQRLKPLLDIGKPMLTVLTADVSLVHFNALEIGLQINTTRNQRDQAGAWIDPTFNLFQVPDHDPLRRYPPLIVPFGEVKYTASTDIALKQRVGGIKTDQPFWCFSEQDGRKSGVLLAEGWWRWRLFDRVLEQETSWVDDMVQKSVQYLALRTKRARLNVEVADRLVEGDKIILTAEYYNPSFELSTDVPITLDVVKNDSTPYSYTFKPVTNGYRLDLGTLGPGTYSWSAAAESNGERFEQNGNFEVTENRSEYQRSVAQHDELSYLAEQRNGEAFTLVEQDALLQRLTNLEAAKPIIHTSRTWKSFIDWEPLLFLLVTLISIEWLLRKINGYV